MNKYNSNAIKAVEKPISHNSILSFLGMKLTKLLLFLSQIWNTSLLTVLWGQASDYYRMITRHKLFITRKRDTEQNYMMVLTTFEIIKMVAQLLQSNISFNAPENQGEVHYYL